MSEPDLFESENGVLARARAVFGNPDAGAQAYRDTLGELIGYYERLMRETRRLIRRSDREELEMNRLNHRLQDLARELEFRATRDTLTGALNRGAIIERAGAVLARDSLSLIVLDIDHFKRVNDSMGHPVGDTVIRGVVDCLEQSVQGAGVIGRVGGEEFAALLPACALDAAVELAERMRLQIEQHVFPVKAGLQVTASFGVSWSPLGRASSRPMRALTRPYIRPSAAGVTGSSVCGRASWWCLCVEAPRRSGSRETTSHKQATSWRGALGATCGRSRPGQLTGLACTASGKPVSNVVRTSSRCLSSPAFR